MNRRTFISSTFATLAVTTNPVFANAPSKAIAYETFDSYFVLNTIKPNKGKNYKFGVCTTIEEFEKLFHPAPVMFSKQKFVEPEYFTDHAIVYWIEWGNTPWQYTVESITNDGKTLTVSYTREGKESKTAQFAPILLVGIKKTDLRKAKPEFKLRSERREARSENSQSSLISRFSLLFLALVLGLTSPVMSQEANTQTNSKSGYAWQQQATTAVDSSVTTSDQSAVKSAVKSKIKSVSLFKNGVALVREEFTVPTGGKYVLNTIPYSIHGTFFVESDAELETTVTQVPIRLQVGELDSMNYQKDLAGKRVRIFFHSTAVPPLTGTVVAIHVSGKTQKPVSASEFPENRYPYFNSAYYCPNSENQPTDPILIVDSDFGQAVFRQSTIARIDVEGGIGTVLKKKPAMVFRITSDKPATVAITYLTKGIAWSPAYKITLKDENSNSGEMFIEQTATIVNQWQKFTDAQVSLISGYPKVECENVISPMSNNANLSAFFSQMNNVGNSPNRGNVMSQMVMNSAPVGRSDELPTGDVAAMGDGPDIYYHSIGERSMEQGDVTSLSTGKQTAEYQRIVEWTVQDNRDEWGRVRDDKQNNNVPWDVIRFKNPFAFPMTTAPASVMTANRFLGQNVSYWTSPGEKTSIPITKSLSVSVKSEEQETNRGTEMRYMGHTCRKVSVTATLTVVNRRSEPTPMVVTKQFSGDVTKNENEGTVTLLANENLNAFNRQNRIVWEFTLEPGEKKVLQYEYDVYVL